jgi:hypothetical protein
MALRLYALVSEQTQKAVELYESRAGGRGRILQRFGPTILTWRRFLRV